MDLMCRVAAFTGVTVLFAVSAAAQPPVTFTTDVAPLLYNHCVACHRPDGDAPFSLISFDDARRHATQIVAVAQSRYMPPWKPEGEGGPFVGERRLTDAELVVLKRWVDGGAIEGPASALPSPPRSPDGWQLGTPDMVLTLAPYMLRADGPDVFRNFVVTVPGSGTLWVRGVEFRPRSRGVHHANIRVDPTTASRQLDAADPDGGYEGLILRSADFPSGHFLGWTPGQSPPLAPPELAWPLRAGTDLVVQLHMRPIGRQEHIEPIIGLYLSRTPGTKRPSIVRLGKQNLDIPAGASNYTVTDDFVLPVDAQVLAIQPHAHYRAHDVRVWAESLDGTRRPLLHIARWDFAWQDQYRYASPFWLTAGTRIVMEYHFDNSEQNPHNPDHPSQRVGWGWRSADEMADVWVQIMARSDVDGEAFDRESRRKMLSEDAIGSELLASRYPGQASVRNDAALIYLSLGRPADALRHFSAVTELEPASAVAWYNEGTVLELLRRPQDAAERYRRAIELNPRYSAAHNNLGNLLIAGGQAQLAIEEYRRAVDSDTDNAEAQNNLGGLLVTTAPAEAESHLRAALRARPDFAEAHFNLGRVLTMNGAAAEAVGEYRAALDARADWRPALFNLAWLLAAHPDAGIRRPAEAVALAMHVVAIGDKPEPVALDLLAVAQASAGNFVEAIRTANDAIRLAEAAGQSPLASQIRERLALYEQRRPFTVE
jgi:tetratricopeptide (TPR) repeat protein